MKDFLKSFFDERKIEYYSVLAYSDVRETGHEIIARENFTPKSVIVYLLPYYVREGVNLSRYATSLDYHIILRETADALISGLRSIKEGISAKGYGDHSPIDERHAALVSGLGILGDSGLLINEKYGTYVFIGDVITDIPPEEIGGVEPKDIKLCEGCGACKRACPTGILRGEGCDCLSAITQRKGDLTDEEVSMMRKFNTVWGCDLCQSSCPHNREPVVTQLDFFKQERIEELTTDTLMGLSKDEFKKRAFAWRGRTTVLRNLKYLGY